MLCFRFYHGPIIYAPLFSHAYYWYVVGMCDTESIGGGEDEWLKSIFTKGGAGTACSFGWQKMNKFLFVSLYLELISFCEWV